MRIGVIADTHGLFDPTLRRHFASVDHIVHAGDIGDRSVIRQLEAIAPVTAVSGNIDHYKRSGFPREAVIELGGKRIGVCHLLYESGKLTGSGRAFLQRVRPDVCVFGHTHQPRTEQWETTLLFNPGSAGPRRFQLPRAVGIIDIIDGCVRTRHLSLGVEDSGNRSERRRGLGSTVNSPGRRRSPKLRGSI